MWRHSPYDDKTFSVHQAVADSVNDQYENQFWMTMGQLAKKARCSRPTAVEAMQRLVAGGFVEVLKESRGGGSDQWERASLYRFLFPDKAVVFEGRLPKAGVKRLNTATVKPVNTAGVKPGTVGVKSGDRDNKGIAPLQLNSNEPKGARAREDNLQKPYAAYPPPWDPDIQARRQKELEAKADLAPQIQQRDPEAATKALANLKELKGAVGQ